MDALVYEDTPFATYFEGEAVPYTLSRELTPPHTPFAPKGLPDFKNRLKSIRRNKPSIAPVSTEQLLERFRYIIVASQLLSDEVGLQAVSPDSEFARLDTTSLTGATATAAVSFLVAWALHWLRNRKKRFEISSWFDVLIYSAGLILLAAGVIFLAYKQYTKHVQRTAVQILSKLVDDSHGFDTTAGGVIRFIQEVEVIARGYELNLPLPPVSRLEDRQTIRRCRTLRSEIAISLRLLTMFLIESHNTIQPFVDSIDVQRYHDIYEVSLVEYSQVIEYANTIDEEAEESIKDIRFALHHHATARKVFLCDLLALKSTSGTDRLHQWRNVLRILRELEIETATRQHSLSSILSVEEWGNARKPHAVQRSASVSSQSDGDETTNNPGLKARMRRFDDVTQSIRALNAKVHLLKEEIQGLTTSNTDDTVVASALGKYYESLGTDIRSLVVDWEKGRNTLLLHIDNDANNSNNHYRTSSSIKAPLSPSPSLGGTTVVDGGPAEAFRLLSGDSDLDSSGSSTPLRKKSIVDLDEKVFEGVASRSSRKSLSASGMTREEKIAKLQEERRKRATMQEQADNTTSMLRELRMVMKHRPQGSINLPAQRVTSV